MWFLLQFKAHKTICQLKSALALQAAPYLFLDELMRDMHTPPQIAKRISLLLPRTLFLSGEYLTVRNFIHSNQSLVKGTTPVRRASKKLMHFSDDEVKQLIVLLKMPKEYPVMWLSTFPENEDLKEWEVQSGAIKGLHGWLRMGPSSHGRPFYVQLLGMLRMCVRVPAACVAEAKHEDTTKRQGVVTDEMRKWVLLSAHMVPAFLRYIESIGMKGESFVPTYVRLRSRGLKERINLLPGYLFYHATPQEIERLKNIGTDYYAYMVCDEAQKPLEISAAQMEALCSFLTCYREQPRAKTEDEKNGSSIKLLVDNQTIQPDQRLLIELDGVSQPVTLVAQISPP